MQFIPPEIKKQHALLVEIHNGSANTKILQCLGVISIIQLKCIREVFSDALSSLPISGYFCIISALTVTPAWLWKSQAASVIATCYARTSTKTKKKIIRPDFGRSYRHLYFSKQPMKTGHSTLLCYIIPSLPHPVSRGYFRNRYRGKRFFNTRPCPWFTLH